ncbi:proline--tRNA ligase [Marispirochaeta sp.]|jgi:prolyl-tRNA synthetase|uniref:proline--tRNA ligase n=1 Tax=Marispirochaeta sp. TaxID=2038653 RepID=UPI0029C6B53D|nr:proline--tRNA ligase [Marispirochaeta sp.]
MLYSRLFGKTLRERPQENSSRSFQVLQQAGYIRSLSPGLFSFLPLGIRVFRRIQEIIRQEMEVLGGQEVLVPLVNPYEIWKQGGRAELVGRSLVRFQDHQGREFVLSPTHEEAMVELLRIGLNSYRDLPVLLYQFQTKFRDEEQLKGGLLRSMEFIMKDAYSFHRSYSDLNNFFPRMFRAYQRIFERLDLKVIAAESGVGFMGGHKAYEFLMPSKEGEDVIVICEHCGYKANRDIAIAHKEYGSENPLPIQKILTPECDSMNRLSRFLQLPKSKLAKSMMYQSPQGLVMAVVRGDYEVSIDKLSKISGCDIIALAHIESLRELGIAPGYLSPLGIPEGIMLVVDDTVANSNNLVMGGNESGLHYVNTNFGRDFETSLVGDIARIRGRDSCFQCGHSLKEIRAIELGNIFKLGDVYSRAMGLEFQDDKRRRYYPQMGSYGIGIGRLLNAAAAAHRDDKGIGWPVEIAPFKVFLMGIGKSHKVRQVVFNLYEELGPEIALLDDRIESPGVKFFDADLIGIPYRVVVTSGLLLNDEVEVYERASGKIWQVPLRELVSQVLAY